MSRHLQQQRSLVCDHLCELRRSIFPTGFALLTANVVSLSDVYADDKLLNEPTEMRTVRTNMLSNPLQQLYVWHLEHRLRELGERQEANPPEP
jgi:hypothetical protein